MILWLINPYGPIPGEGWRDYRFTMIGEMLAQHGHQVTWWTANFSHHFKRFRSVGWMDLTINPNFRIRLVPTSGYQKHIGLGRVRFELLFAWRMYHHAVRLSPPRCIIAVDPPQTIGIMAVKLAKKLGSSLILDVMDLWPELFTLAFPKCLKPLVPSIFSLLYIVRQHNWRKAHAITALCNTYLETAKKGCNNMKKPFVTIFNGIDVQRFRSLAKDLKTISQNLSLVIQNRNINEIWAVYAGTLGENYDILTLLESARQLYQRKINIKILIAGEGPLKENVIEFAKQKNNIVYLGKLNPEELSSLYRLCDIGICAYGPESNVAMPDKAYDYMAAGLPIINSLQGELENLLRDHRIGIQYQAGNPKSLAEALESLAMDEKKRKDMSRNSYNVAMRFDRHAQYQKFVDLVEEL